MTPASLRAEARTVATTAEQLAEANPLFALPLMGIIAFAIGIGMLTIAAEAWSSRP